VAGCSALVAVPRARGGVAVSGVVSMLLPSAARQAARRWRGASAGAAATDTEMARRAGPGGARWHRRSGVGASRPHGRPRQIWARWRPLLAQRGGGRPKDAALGASTAIATGVWASLAPPRTLGRRPGWRAPAAARPANAARRAGPAGPDGSGHVRAEGVAAHRGWHDRVSSSPTASLAKQRRALTPEGQDQSTGSRN
jgi:hypothetical protein